jgi:hypothetical protein
MGFTGNEGCGIINFDFQNQVIVAGRLEGWKAG